ncbi:MAG: ATPase, partial [Zunongwangia sp.]|nr:ATPase [Zunongwangia sp.]
ARRAHNPKVTGSSPVPATSNDKASQKCEAFFYFI